ncbi:MAG: hypothetical protein ACKOTA_05510, partial [Solirubrobacterales bacterium]
MERLPAFYFDLASLEAYLSAERILSLMPAPVEWIGIGAVELAGHRRGVDRLEQGGGMHLAGGAGDGDAVVVERPPGGERLAPRGEGERDRPADLPGVGGGEHRPPRVEGEGVGEPELLQAAGGDPLAGHPDLPRRVGRRGEFPGVEFGGPVIGTEEAWA